LEKKLAEALEKLKKAGDEGTSQDGDASAEIEKVRVEVRSLREELAKAKEAEERASKVMAIAGARKANAIKDHPSKSWSSIP
jgi:DNA-binding protein H-NS